MQLRRIRANHLVLLEGAGKGIAGFFSLQIVLKTLTPAQFSDYTKLFLVFQIILAIASAPAAATLSLQITKTTNPRDRANIAGISILWVMLTCLLLQSILIVFPGTALQDLAPSSRPFVLYLPLAALFSSLNQLVVQLLLGLKNIRKAVIISNINLGITAFLTIIFTLLFRFNGAIFSILVCPVVSFLLCAPFYLGALRRYLGYIYSSPTDIFKSLSSVLAISLHGFIFPFLNNLVFLLGINLYASRFGNQMASYAIFASRIGDYGASIVSSGLPNYLTTIKESKSKLLSKSEKEILVLLIAILFLSYLVAWQYPELVIGLISNNSYLPSIVFVKTEILILGFKCIYWVLLFKSFRESGMSIFYKIELVCIVIQGAALLVFIRIGMQMAFQYAWIAKLAFGTVMAIFTLRKSHEMNLYHD
jgi:hypothetical protein